MRRLLPSGPQAKNGVTEGHWQSQWETELSMGKGSIPATLAWRRGSVWFRTGNLVLVGGALLSQLPLVWVHLQKLWRNEHYQFFPLVLLAFAWLIYQRWPDAPQPLRLRHRIAGVGLIILSLASFGVAVVLWSPWLATVGCILTAGFLLLQFGQGEAIRRFGHAWLLLLLLLPLPFRLDDELVTLLQALSAQTASLWLDAFGFNHVLTGHVIIVPGHRFVVEEACSGSNSLFVLVALAAIFAAIKRYPLLHIALLLGSAVAWAIVGNAMRIVALVVSELRWGLDLSSGLGHTALGLAAVGTMYLFLLSTDRILLFLLAPSRWERPVEDADTVEDPVEEEEQPGSSDPQPAGPPAATPRHRLPKPLLGSRLAWTVGILFIATGLAQALPFVGAKDLESEAMQHVSVRADTISRLPENWQLISFDGVERGGNFGSQSVFWDYRREHLGARLSLDYPFTGWHELPICYSFQGWEVSGRRKLSNGLQPSASSETIEVDLEKPTGEFGYLLVSLFDEQGRWVLPPDKPWERCLDSIKSRLSRRGMNAAAGGFSDAPAYQFQVFVSSSVPLTDVERRHIADLYFMAREQVRGYLVDGSQTKILTAPPNS